MDQATIDKGQHSAKRPAGSPTTPQPSKTERHPIVLSSALSKTTALNFRDALSKGTGHEHGKSLEAPIPLNLTFKAGRTKPPKGSLSEAVDKTLFEEEANRRARREVLTTAATALDKAFEAFDAGPHKTWATQTRDHLRSALLQLVGKTTQTSVTKPHQDNLGSTPSAKQDTTSGASNPAPPQKQRAPPPAPGHARPSQQAAHKTLRTAPQPAGNGPARSTQKAPVPTTAWTTVVDKRQQKQRAPRTDSSGLKERPDDRLFLRVPPGHDMANRTPTDIRLTLVEITGLTLADIKEVQKVRSGFAIRARNQESYERLQHPYPFFEKNGLHFEEAQQWHTYIVAGVPRALHGHRGSTPVDQLLHAEAKAATGEPPISCRLSKHQAAENDAPVRDWVISFARPVKAGFKVFGSKPARRVEKKAQVTQCTSCWDFHDPRNCNRAAKCVACSAPAHPQDQGCAGPNRCTNCHGPHKASDQTCPARPKRKDGQLQRPSKKQLQSLRQIGARAFTAAHGTDRPAPQQAGKSADRPAPEATTYEGPLPEESRDHREPSVATLPTPTPVSRTANLQVQLQRTQSVHGRQNSRETARVAAPPVPPVPANFHLIRREPTRTVSPPPDIDGDEDNEEMTDAPAPAVQ